MKKNVSIEGRRFVDRDGHEVILHGINMVCKDKDKNYLGGYDLNDFYFLRAKGFNVIRLGLFWDGVEPLPGAFDEKYLKGIDSIINNAAAAGINVYLDMHQDLFGAKFCDGAPLWATLTEGIDHYPTELWSEAYLVSPAVQTAFDRFWEDAPASDGVGIRTHFANMWKMLAARYKDKENVIGYDFFNEPFLGTPGAMVMPVLFTVLAELIGPEFDEEITAETIMEMWGDEEKKLMLLDRFSEKEEYKGLINAPGEIIEKFDKEVLNGFYKEMTETVRAVDKETLIFLEANYFCNTGIRSFVEPVSIDGVKDAHQVYSPHGYDILVDTDAYDHPGYGRLDVIFDMHKETGERMDVPVLVGEWGCFPNAGDSEVAQAKYIMDIFSKNLFSDTYYDFSHIKDNRVLEAIARPYPMQVPGTVKDYSYDYDKKTLTATIDEKMKGVSVFFVPFKPDIEFLTKEFGAGKYKVVSFDVPASEAAYVYVPSNVKGLRTITIR